MNKIEPKSTWADFFRLVKTVISSKILLVLAIVLNALSSFVTLMIPLFTNLLKRSLRILFKNGGQMDGFGFGLSIYNISYLNTH